MRKHLLTLLITSTFVIGACSNEQTEVEQLQELNEDVEESVVDEVIDKKALIGNFENIDARSNSESSDHGPINFTINKVVLASGTLTDESIIKENGGRENYNVVEIEVEFENTHEKLVEFPINDAQIQLSNGETSREIDERLSTLFHEEINGVGKQTGTLVFPVSDSVYHIDSVRFMVDQPTGENGNGLGESVDMSIDFS